MKSIESLNPEYLLLAVLGIIIHVLMKVVERKDRSKKLSVKAFVSDKMNLVRIMLSLTSVLAILLMADDIADMLKITLSDDSPARKIMAFLAGYLNHSLIRNVLKMLKSRTFGNDETEQNK
jgi:hypothetical protein